MLKTWKTELHLDRSVAKDPKRIEGLWCSNPVRDLNLSKKDKLVLS